MSQEPEKNPKEDPLGKMLLVIVGVFAVLILLRFIFYLLSDGWSAASAEVPAGKVVFFMVIGFLVFISGPWLMDQGFHSAGKTITIFVGIIAVLTVISIMPSCSNEGSDSNSDLPYYRN